MNNRIRQIRKDAELTQQQFADKIGVNRLLISQWERGAVKPGRMRLYQIAELFSVNLEWLNTGKGEVYKSADFEPPRVANAKESKGDFFKRILTALTDKEIDDLEDEIKKRKKAR